MDDQGADRGGVEYLNGQSQHGLNLAHVEDHLGVILGSAAGNKRGQ
jgi:hypothetical protein